jgi:hypothetical protein
MSLEDYYKAGFAQTLAEQEKIEARLKRTGKIMRNTTANAIDRIGRASAAHKIIYAISFIVIAIISFQVFKKIYNIIIYKKSASPWLIRGTRDASKRLVIRQDPSKSDSVNLRRSENQYGGLEFTYMWWMYVNDSGETKKARQQIFYKGDPLGKTYAPKVFLTNGSSTIKILMNTFDNEDNEVEINNIPAKKWVHVVLSVRQRDIDVYVNGELAKRTVLSSIPKQNNGDLYISPDRGFNGNISNFKYFNYFVTFKEIDQYLQLGPSKKPQIEEGDKPPYFSSNWWINN